MSESVYIHGTSEEEQRRLSLMNDVLLNPASIREMGLRGDESILDFGAGLGQFTRLMAHAVPRGRVVGIERNEEQLAGARKLAEADAEKVRVGFRSGDVLDQTPSGHREPAASRRGRASPSARERGCEPSGGAGKS